MELFVPTALASLALLLRYAVQLLPLLSDRVNRRAVRLAKAKNQRR
jgi:hypothetical protein